MADRPVSVIGFAEAPLGVQHRTLDAERVLAGDPQHDIRSFFESPDGNLTAGVWRSTPGKWRAFTDRDEFCYIIEGHCRLTNEAGEATTFKTGDAFLIPNGFRGTWEVIETTTKHYVIRKHTED